MCLIEVTYKVSFQICQQKNEFESDRDVASVELRVLLGETHQPDYWAPGTTVPLNTGSVM